MKNEIIQKMRDVIEFLKNEIETEKKNKEFQHHYSLRNTIDSRVADYSDAVNAINGCIRRIQFNQPLDVPVQAFNIKAPLDEQLEKALKDTANYLSSNAKRENIGITLSDFPEFKETKPLELSREEFESICVCLNKLTQNNKEDFLSDEAKKLVDDYRCKHGLKIITSTTKHDASFTYVPDKETTKPNIVINDTYKSVEPNKDIGG